MGATKVVLDTNILISALGWKGNPRTIFERCLGGDLELVISSAQLEELKRVLDYPKFNFSPEQKNMFLSIIVETATMIDIAGNLKVITDDVDDNMLLETAMTAKVHYLVSGDDHLLKLKEFSSVKILTASEFLRRL